MPKTKSFRVAVEGDTVDGRKIERSWLTDAASTYNRTTYGARVNMEHIRGVTADKPFKSYGDVLSLSTEEIELELGGKKQKRLALNAEIEATDDLVAMNADSQKIFTSIEIQPNFANTGKAYLVGLAVTDSPASLGTEALTFAVKHPDAVRYGPKPQQEGNVFSVGLETSFALAAGEVANPPADSAAGLFAAAAAFFKNFGKVEEKPADPAPPADPTPPTPANDNDAKFAAMISGIEKLTTGVTQMGTELRAEIGKVRTDHDKLAASIDTTEKPKGFTRQPATGGSGRTRGRF